MRRTVILASCLFALPAVAMAEGLPQLDFKDPLTTSQVVWLAVIFGFLYVLLSRWALPKVEDVLAARATSIAADLDRARDAKAKSDAAVAAMNEATREARTAAQVEIAAAIERSKESITAQAAELNARLEAQLAAGEQRISAARAAAMGALQEVVTDTVDLVVTRLTGSSPARGVVDQAVGAALLARGQG